MLLECSFRKTKYYYYYYYSPDGALEVSEGCIVAAVVLQGMSYVVEQFSVALVHS